MLLAGTALINLYIAQKGRLQSKLRELGDKLMAFHSYASAISDGEISLRDFLSVPGSMYNNLSIFMQNSHFSAMSTMQQQLPYLLSMAQNTPTVMQNPMLAQQYIARQIYTQAKAEFTKMERKRLDSIEIDINQEKEQVERELAMVTEQIKNLKEGTKKASEEAAPKYV